MEKKVMCIMLLLQQITTLKLRNTFMLDYQGSGQKPIEDNPSKYRFNLLSYLINQLSIHINFTDKLKLYLFYYLNLNIT